MVFQLQFLSLAFKATLNLALWTAGLGRGDPAGMVWTPLLLWLHLNLPLPSISLSSLCSWNIPDCLLLWGLQAAVFLCLEDS